MTEQWNVLLIECKRIFPVSLLLSHILTYSTLKEQVMIIQLYLISEMKVKC